MELLSPISFFVLSIFFTISFATHVASHHHARFAATTSSFESNFHRYLQTTRTMLRFILISVLTMPAVFTSAQGERASDVAINRPVVVSKEEELQVPHGILSSDEYFDAPKFVPGEQEQRRRLSSTCYRWETFDDQHFNQMHVHSELASKGWVTATPGWGEIFVYPDHLTFEISMEKALPSGGDFVRVRYGSVGCHYCHSSLGTVLEVGGVTVGTTAGTWHYDEEPPYYVNGYTPSDVTTDAVYADGDTVKLDKQYFTIGSVYSVDICNYDAPAPSAKSSAPGAGSCFHGDGTVSLKSGSSKRFSELSLGDVIKTSDGQGSFSFNAVLALPHANNEELAAFLALTTETGKQVNMTPGHFIPKCDLSEVTAGGLVVGDCLLTVDGKETLVEISSASKKGVYTAITQDNFILVDGFVASSFSKDFGRAKPELDYEKYLPKLEGKRNRQTLRNKSLLRGANLVSYD